MHERYALLDPLISAAFTVNENWQHRGCSCNEDPTPKWFWRGDWLEEGVEDYAVTENCMCAGLSREFSSHVPFTGTDTPREVWNFGRPGEPFYDALVKNIELRYRLMPYIYPVQQESGQMIIQ